jgi:3-deoxy-manno-octulosonate cytidylyltransferase (CMP-KDO synthetase)
MSPIEFESDFRSTTVPKVVTDETGRLLYISRAAIPTSKSLEFRTARRQVGLYGFRDRALRAFADSPAKTALEEIEDIEILRLLELGHVIQMVEVDSGGPAVDTPDDLVRAHEHLRLLAEKERSS